MNGKQSRQKAYTRTLYAPYYDEMRDYLIMKFISKASIIAGAITLAFAFTVLPADATVAEEADVNININGTLLQLPEGEQQAEIIGDRTYVPLRVISEDLGARVDWKEETQQVIINTQSIDIEPSSTGTSGEIEIIIDGKSLAIPEGYGKAFIKQSRTMIPLRAVSEALDCKVEWVNDTRTAVITGTVVQPPIVAQPEPEQSTEVVDPQLLNNLAQYRSNLKLMDGTVINSAELLNMDASKFSAEQLGRFKSYLEELNQYPQTFDLPGGEQLNPETIGIMGTSQLTADQMEAWICNETPRIKSKMESMGREFIPIPQLAELYLKIGEEYGVRGDIAYFQAVKETNYFQFTGSVQPWQNNYCGLWATGSPCTGQESLNGADPNYVSFQAGVHGAIFASTEAGVEAHIQHLYAYATKQALPEGKVLVDPRYSLVSKGIAPAWMELNARWAVPGTTYGQSILYDYWLKAF